MRKLMSISAITLIAALIGVVASAQLLSGQVHPLVECKALACVSGDGDPYCLNQGCSTCTTGGTLNEHCLYVQ